jgi:hypothetical protein
VPNLSRCSRRSLVNSGWVGTMRLSPQARCLSCRRSRELPSSVHSLPTSGVALRMCSSPQSSSSGLPGRGRITLSAAMPHSICPLPVVEELASKLPAGTTRLVRLPQARHEILRDRPDLAFPAIEDFIRWVKETDPRPGDPSPGFGACEEEGKIQQSEARRPRRLYPHLLGSATPLEVTKTRPLNLTLP